jgi:hypothetical protein
LQGRPAKREELKMAILRERIPVPTSIKTKRSAELKRKLAMLNATLVLAGLCSAGLVAQSVSSGPAQTHSQAAQVAGLKDSGKKISSLPVAAQRTISGTLGGDDERYRVIANGSGAHAENPQHALAADFTPQGVEVRSGTARWGLALRRYGYGGVLHAVAGAALKVNGNRVESVTDEDAI